ncbi:uncharacterized protein LOC134318689 [Trichomycterus rosablanca]|uniref:uncharacterized protein LOC134318689 n=1 Tax=Trichomycterus rosablanca TaxID=2290929 RepID=UPI002F353FC5
MTPKRLLVWKVPLDVCWGPVEYLPSGLIVAGWFRPSSSGYATFILSTEEKGKAQTVGHNEPLILSVKAGERVTLNCAFLDKLDKMLWYKQRFGEMPQKVGERLTHNEINISPEFNKSGLKMEKTKTGISLTFLHINKEDEGLYFCGVLSWVKNLLSSGTFVSVTGDQECSVSVFQNWTGELDSFTEGESVNLKCTVLSKSTISDLPVLWFRSAAPQSRPQIIYTHHNSSHQCKTSSSTYTCVYNFSKNILTINDTGTYYCAVAMCGKIIFGNGTTVQLASVDYLWKFLAVALVVCITVIIVQSVLICKIRSCKPYRVTQGSVIEKANNQDCDAVMLNYAALHFNERKGKKSRGKRQPAQDCVYSEVMKTS